MYGDAAASFRRWWRCFSAANAIAINSRVVLGMSARSFPAIIVYPQNRVSQDFRKHRLVGCHVRPDADFHEENYKMCPLRPPLRRAPCIVRGSGDGLLEALPVGSGQLLPTTRVLPATDTEVEVQPEALDGLGRAAAQFGVSTLVWRPLTCCTGRKKLF